MLPASHNRAYQDFLSLLTELNDLLLDQTKQTNRLKLQRQLSDLPQWYEHNVDSLDRDNLDSIIAARWQSIHTEIKRELKLLATDILFLSSARQKTTASKRLKSISDRLNKLINYCQIILKNSD